MCICNMEWGRMWCVCRGSGGHKLSGRWRINITLIVWMSTEGEHGLPATDAAAVKSVPGDDFFICSLGLRTRECLSPFFTRSGERRKADILVSVKLLSFFPRNVALATLYLTSNIKCRRGIIMRQAPRVHCSDKSSSLGDSKTVNECNRIRKSHL